MNKLIIAQSLLLALLLSSCTNPSDVPIPEFPRAAFFHKPIPSVPAQRGNLKVCTSLSRERTGSGTGW